MTPERWQQVRAVFDIAVEQPSFEADDFARRACGDDEDLFREVQEMLRAHRETAFVDHPPLGPARERLLLEPLRYFTRGKSSLAVTESYATSAAAAWARSTKRGI